MPVLSEKVRDVSLLYRAANSLRAFHFVISAVNSRAVPAR